MTQGGVPISYTQIVHPRLDIKVSSGWCLKFVQDSFRAPVMHATATIAADATKLRNDSRTMPNVAVPVWFWHYGTYNGVSGEYGHVVIWVPGRGFLSSPLSGFGSLWLSSIEAVERTFNAKYRFWSLDINTLQVASKTTDPTTPDSGQEEDEELKAVYYMEGKNYIVLIFDSRSGFATEYSTADYKYNNTIAGLGTGSFVKVSKSHYNKLKSDLENVRKGK